MNEFASLQPLLPLSEQNKSEKKHGSLGCDNPVAWPFTSPVQNSTVCVCAMFLTEMKPFKEDSKDYNLGTLLRFFCGVVSESFITLTVIQQETRKDF